MRSRYEPNFSVVIPLHNKAGHVAATVRTALAQSRPAHEIIVVDDASTDDGPAIVRAIGNPRIRMLARDVPGPGGYAARNLGIEAATGDWIAFLDADDSWHPDHLLRLSEVIAGAPEEVGGAFSGVWIVEGKEQRPYEVNGRYLRPGVTLTLTDIARAWLAGRDCPIWTGAAAFRRDVLIAAGLFPAGRALRGGDKDLWMRAAALTRLAYSPERTACFHQDTQNRVSNLTTHLELPILLSTVAAMLPGADPDLRRLLRRLANREVGRYAKRTTRAGVRVPVMFRRALYYPSGLPELGYLIGLGIIRPYVVAILGRSRA